MNEQRHEPHMMDEDHFLTLVQHFPMTMALGLVNYNRKNFTLAREYMEAECTRLSYLPGNDYTIVYPDASIYEFEEWVYDHDLEDTLLIRRNNDCITISWTDWDVRYIINMSTDDTSRV